MNHPAGRIGKRLMLRVSDLMLTGQELPLAKPQESVMEVTSQQTPLPEACLGSICIKNTPSCKQGFERMQLGY